MPNRPPTAPAAVLITGTVGSGKTTTAWAVADLLRHDRVPHAVIDVDALRSAWPSPDGDPFHTGDTAADVARAVVRALGWASTAG